MWRRYFSREDHKGRIVQTLWRYSVTQSVQLEFNFHLWGSAPLSVWRQSPSFRVSYPNLSLTTSFLLSVGNPKACKGLAPEFPRSSHKAVSRLPSCYGEPMVPVTPSFFSSSDVSRPNNHRRKAASIFGETPRLCSLSLSSLFNPIAQSGDRE